MKLSVSLSSRRADASSPSFGKRSSLPKLFTKRVFA
jgi:hypothetical protein